METLTYELKSTTLDREFAEEKVQGLEEDLEKWKQRATTAEERLKDLEKEIKSSDRRANREENNKSQQLEESLKGLDKLKEEVASLSDENGRLREALIKLREISVADQTKREKRIKELIRENENLSHNLSHQTFLYNSLLETIKTVDPTKIVVEDTEEDTF